MGDNTLCCLLRGLCVFAAVLGAGWRSVSTGHPSLAGAPVFGQQQVGPPRHAEDHPIPPKPQTRHSEFGSFRFQFFHVRVPGSSSFLSYFALSVPSTSSQSCWDAVRGGLLWDLRRSPPQCETRFVVVVVLVVLSQATSWIKRGWTVWHGGCPKMSTFATSSSDPPSQRTWSLWDVLSKRIAVCGL